MHRLKLVCENLIELLKRAGRLLGLRRAAVRRRRRGLVLREREAERLDRLRNPSKYQGR